VNVSLPDAADSSYVAYAYNGWRWESVVLNKEKSSVSIPLKDLIQIEITSKKQVIRGFDKMWDFFICYDGNAVCFYLLAEIL
jgi:hypothetical protein